MASPWKAPHILVFPFPAHSHVNAAMDISKKLASFGVSVSFVCTEAYIDNMRKQGFESRGLSIRLLGLPDGLPPEKSRTDALHQIEVLITATESMGPALQALLSKLNKENPVACIVYDFMLWWVGRLGTELHTPAYIFYPMSSSFYSYTIHIPGFVSEGRLPLGAHTDVREASNVFSIAGFPDLHVSEVPDIYWKPNPVCSFDFALHCATHWRDASGILLNTIYELEREVIHGLRARAPEMDIRAVGPALTSSFLRREMSKEETAMEISPDSQRCLSWLEEQPPSSVLYVAFGTIVCLSREQARAVAMGLEASGERFVLVVRVREVEERAGMGLEGFEERIRGRGVVLWELAPQRRILSSEAIGGFLTHCGWNSTWEGLCQGVPLLCWPFFADQGMNAKWVVEVLQAGCMLVQKSSWSASGSDGGDHNQNRVEMVVKKEVVERKVREIMKRDHPARASAGRIRDIALHAALDSAGSSVKNFHAFVQILLNKEESLHD